MGTYIGTSGWSYRHWEGILYPPGSSSPQRLEQYLRRFDTVEVNYTFYRWPRDETFRSWRERTPPGFRMTIKASRGLTHARRLLQPEVWTERIARGVAELGDRLGVVLAQLPPQMACDLGRLEAFLVQWPRELPLAVEFRHPSWHVEEVFAVLERFGAAYCVMSGAHLPCVLRATAPFVYVRFHGPDPNVLYGGAYSDADLRWWAERIREWEGQGHAVWAYFNNDWAGNAVRNAETLRGLLGIPAPGAIPLLLAG